MNENGTAGYGRFLAMIGTAAVAMFCLKYVTTYAWDHVFFSESRAYVAFLVMTGAMAIIMLAFMLGMYRNRATNMLIFIGGLLAMVAGTWLMRSQYFVTGVDYMQAMIPHHSIAVLTSERADIDDVRVRKLANDIILAQRREIKEMKWLIDDIAANGEVTTEAEAAARPVPDFQAEL